MNLIASIYRSYSGTRRHLILRPGSRPSFILLINSLLSTSIVTGGVVLSRFHRILNMCKTIMTVMVPLFLARSDVSNCGVPVTYPWPRIHFFLLCGNSM